MHGQGLLPRSPKPTRSWPLHNQKTVLLNISFCLPPFVCLHYSLYDLIRMLALFSSRRCSW